MGLEAVARRPRQGRRRRLRQRGIGDRGTHSRSSNDRGEVCAATAKCLDAPAGLLDVADQVETFAAETILAVEEWAQCYRRDNQAEAGQCLCRLVDLRRQALLAGKHEDQAARVARRHVDLQGAEGEAVDLPHLLG